MKLRGFVTIMTIVSLAIITNQAMAMPTVKLQLLNEPTAIGDTFDVQVWADRGDDTDLQLLSFGFDVSFDIGSIFSYDGYTIESGFDDLSDPLNPNNVTGDVFPGISGDDVLLVTLSFSTLARGSDTINVIGLYDGMFYGLFYELPSIELEGYDINASLDITVGTDIIPFISVCSHLGDDPKPSILDQDIFKFYGVKGEEVTVTLSPAEPGSYTGKRATLILKDEIHRTWLFKIDRSALPNVVTATLPAAGKYLVVAAEQAKLAKGKKFTGDYCLTLESSQDAWETFVPTGWVE